MLKYVIKIFSTSGDMLKLTVTKKKQFLLKKIIDKFKMLNGKIELPIKTR